MSNKLFYPKQVVCSILFMMLLMGCNNSEVNQTQQGKSSGEKVHYTKVSTSALDQSVANKAKKKILAMEEITEVQAVSLDNNLYIAAKPQHHERFQLEKLKKKIQTTLQKMYPKMKIYVSVDKKITMLLNELENNIQEENITKDEVKKKLKKIRVDMNSDT